MTISKERLNILQQTFKATAKTSETLEAAALNDAAAAISELLAVREAKSVPIYQIKIGEYSVLTGYTKGVWEECDDFVYEAADPELRRIVYTAPPAPAPAVPDQLTSVITAMIDNPKVVEFYSSAWEFNDDSGHKWLEKIRAAMLQPVSQGCKWTYDEHDYKWDSACGESWQFTDGGPEDNGVKFCQGCGKPVVLAAAPTPTK